MVIEQSNSGIIQLGNVTPTKTRANPNQGRVYDISGCCPSLNQCGGGNRQPFIFKQDKISKDDIVYRIRKLTPKECWRLMGFDDSDYEKAASVNSNTQLYKQAGNSIVKNVLIAILGQLIPGKENYYKK